MGEKRDSYSQLKNFKNIYETEGAYHHQAQGFTAWFLKDNYTAIGREAPPHRVVLDLACGEGCLGPYLKAKRLVGVDYSKSALQWNRQIHPGIYDELVPGDMRSLERLPFSPGSFDLVACSLSLMYLIREDLRNCLRQVRRWLVPGGLFLFSYPTVGPNRQASRDAVELPPEQLQAEVETAGFLIEKLQPLCPWIPSEAVERSRTDDRVFALYQEAKRAMTLETSYHFFCKAKKG